MRDDLHVILLAGGDGLRLRGRAFDGKGRPAPKQYCDPGTGRTLIAAALDRAAVLVPPERVRAIVTASHRKWWREAFETLPAANVIVQPENRGTAAGILLPLLHVVALDPDAIVVALPSDHHVDDEAAFTGAIADAAREARRRPDDLVMVGMRPDGADESYGWIVPEPATWGATNGVAAFVEKPAHAEAHRLFRTGALWNSFTFCARAGALLDLIENALPWLVDEMRGASGDAEALARLYPSLDHADFSRDVLQAQPHRLRVLAAPPCGWTDLGSPERLDALLDRRRAA